MLETIREYASESGGEDVRRRHAVWFVQLLTDAELEGAEQDRWFDRLEVEHPNVRDALRWSLDVADTDLALRLAGSSAMFWWIRGHWIEGLAWLSEALALEAPRSHALRERALEGAANLAARQHDYVRAHEWVDEGLALCRASGDERGTGRLLRIAGLLAAGEGDDEAFRRLIEKSAEHARAGGR